MPRLASTLISINAIMNLLTKHTLSRVYTYILEKCLHICITYICMYKGILYTHIVFSVQSKAINDQITIILCYGLCLFIQHLTIMSLITFWWLSVYFPFAIKLRSIIVICSFTILVCIDRIYIISCFFTIELAVF